MAGRRPARDSAGGFPDLNFAASLAFAAAKTARQFRDREAIGAELDQAMRK
jgi:hypothetical protein